VRKGLADNRYRLEFLDLSIKELPQSAAKVKGECVYESIPFKAATLKGRGRSLLVIRRDLRS
jgi:hypothetical protein